MNKEIFIFVFFYLIAVGSGIFLGYQASPQIDSIIYKIQNNYNSPKECANLSLMETANCLNENIKSIYKYNLTDDSIDLTLDQLKQRGGDCNDWTKLYKEYANDLGFYTTTPLIKIKKGFAHTFLIMSNKEGYCILDQKMIKCYKIITS